MPDVSVEPSLPMSYNPMMSALDDAAVLADGVEGPPSPATLRSESGTGGTGPVGVSDYFERQSAALNGTGGHGNLPAPGPEQPSEPSCADDMVRTAATCTGMVLTTTTPALLLSAIACATSTASLAECRDSQRMRER